MICRQLLFQVGIVVLGWCSQVARADDDELAREALKIFQTHCVKCHNARDLAGGLSLLDGPSAFAGGVSGEVLDPGDPDSSYLIDLITTEGGRAAMPQEGPPLSAAEQETLAQWIREGAVWPDGVVLAPPHQFDANWWSLRPLIRPTIPSTRANSKQKSERDTTEETQPHPIDAFIYQVLNERGFELSPPADRRILARRLHYDLIGLPPAPEELKAFVEDPDPQAYENLVDRLLNSPRYGERWARHWLDVVQYADTHGYDKDQPRPNAWPYRDYVIRSFNEDKSWGRMIEEQVAGDALFPGTVDGIEALGMIAAGPWDLVGHAEVPESKIDGKIARHLDRDDMVRNVVQSFTSITVGCAQCHNHKFDPINQVEYYRLQAAFAAIDRADKPYDHDPEIAKRREQLTAERTRIEEILAAAIAKLPPEEQSRVGEIELLLDDDLNSEEMSEVAKAKRGLQRVKAKIEELPPRSLVYAGTVHHGQGSFSGTGPSGGKPREIRVLYRGEVTQPREMVEPGGLELVSGVSPEFFIPSNHDESDRRVALARWLSDRENGFTWRSIVNRVWQHHFGQGLVETPNDFGQMGGVPSHPELLDWLACEFRDGGQSLKSLHRLIVTSAAYRQTSNPSLDDPREDARLVADPNNRWLWRANRRKLDAEQFRDTLLLVSNCLDETMGGPGFQEFVMEKPEHSPHYRYELHDFFDAKSHRRSIYRFTVRSQLEPFSNALDCADPSQQVARRNESQTPLQALALLNNGLIMAMSQRFAEKLERLSEIQEINDPEQRLARQIERGFWEVTGRQPTLAEVEELTDFAMGHGLIQVCRVMFNLNELMFID